MHQQMTDGEKKASNEGEQEPVSKPRILHLEIRAAPPRLEPLLFAALLRGSHQSGGPQAEHDRAREAGHSS